MKLTLMIEGSAAAISAVLAALPDGAGEGVQIGVSAPEAGSIPPHDVNKMLDAARADVMQQVTQGNVSTPMPAPAPITSTGSSGTAVPPMPTATIPTADDHDDGAPAGDAPDVDADGLPWDERIHSGNHGLNKDGTWRKRKGVDAAIVQTVTAELRGKQPDPIDPPAPVQIPDRPIPLPVGGMPAQAPTPMPMQPMPTAMPAMQPVPTYQQAPVPQMPSVTAAPQPVSFPEFMTKLAGAMQSGAVTTDYLIQVVQRVNQQFGTQFNAVTDMAVDPEKLGYAVAMMTADGRWS